MDKMDGVNLFFRWKGNSCFKKERGLPACDSQINQRKEGGYLYGNTVED